MFFRVISNLAYHCLDSYASIFFLSALKDVHIHFSSLFKLEGWWVLQIKFEQCSNCEKGTN